MKRSFCQSHESGSYRAKITIEWSHPDRGYNGEHVSRAKDVADELMMEIATKPHVIVQTMRGRR